MAEGQRAAKPGCDPDSSAGHCEVEAKVRWVILSLEWHLALPEPKMAATKSCGGVENQKLGSLFHTGCSTGLLLAEMTCGINTPLVRPSQGVGYVQQRNKREPKSDFH